MKFSRLIAIFLAALVGFGCASKKTQGAVIATFGNDTLTESEYQDKLSRLPQGVRGVALSNRKEFLEDIFAERLLLREAEKRGVYKLQDVKELIETARQKIIVAKLIEIEIDKKISVGPDEAMRYYEARKEEFLTPLLLRASHVLVKTRQEAEQIRKDLLAGGDFEDMARKKSLDAAAARGGDLGFFQKGQFVPEFDEAVFSLKKGALSEVVKTRFGHHLIKLTDRVEPQPKDFKSVSRIIEDRILKERRAEAFKGLVARLKGNAQLQVDEAKLAKAS